MTDDAVNHFLRGRCPVAVACERWLAADPPVEAQRLVSSLFVDIIADVISGVAVWHDVSRFDFDALLPSQREMAEQHAVEHEMARRVMELAASGSETAWLAIRSNVQRFALDQLFGERVA